MSTPRTKLRGGTRLSISAIASLALLLTFAWVPSANADDDDVDWNDHYGVTEEDVEEFEELMSQEVTPELLDQTREDLANSGYSYSVDEIDGVETWVFDISDEATIKLPVYDDLDGESGALQPNIGGGMLNDGFGYYITLSPTDQRALASGGTAALGASICGAVPPACIVATGIAAAATTYVSANGICSNNSTLRIETRNVPPWGPETSAQCV